MTTDLLPCPFCGSPAEKDKFGYTQCSNKQCDVHMTPFTGPAWNRRAPGGWLPIKSAPKKRGPILLSEIDGVVSVGLWEDGQWPSGKEYGWRKAGYNAAGEWEPLEPTHWMPLPPAPEAQPKDEHRRC